MNLFNFFKRKEKETLQNVKLIPKIDNGGLGIVLNVDGVEKDFNKLSKEEQINIANVLQEKSLKQKTNNDNKEVIVEGNTVSVPNIDFYGFDPKYSSNKEYFICHFMGKVVACKGEDLLFDKKAFKPQGGKVSNNGMFIFFDSMNTNELGGIFYIFDSMGAMIFSMDVEANIFTAQISENGDYACFHTLNNHNNKKDAVKLFIIDVNSKLVINSFSSIPEITYPNDYIIDEANKTITFTYKNSEKHYSYKFDGSFLDYEKLEKIKLEEALTDSNGYGLKDIAFNKLSVLENEANLKLDDYSNIIHLLNSSLEKDMSDHVKAICYRQLGEIYETFNLLDKALDHYNMAAEYYPKIGVKRKITSISRIINASCE